MKKPMTKEIAHEIGLGVWTWCAKTGKHKRSWPDWKRYKDYFESSPENVSYCAYCEFSKQWYHNYSCNGCPIHNSYGFCEHMTYFKNWVDSCNDHREDDMSLYAGLFLKQLEAIDINKPWNKKCLKEVVIVSWGYLVSCAEFGCELWARDDGEMVRLPRGSDPLYRGKLVELVLCEEHDDVEWGDKWRMFSGVIPCKKCGRLTAERNSWVWFTF